VIYVETKRVSGGTAMGLLSILRNIKCPVKRRQALLGSNLAEE
jgi:hypothetical protein